MQVAGADSGGENELQQLRDYEQALRDYEHAHELQQQALRLVTTLVGASRPRGRSTLASSESSAARSALGSNDSNLARPRRLAPDGGSGSGDSHDGGGLNAGDVLCASALAPRNHM